MLITEISVCFLKIINLIYQMDILNEFISLGGPKQFISTCANY